jgi:hypothetical protein
MITPISNTTTNASVTKITNVCVVSIVTFDTMLPWSIKSPMAYWSPCLRWLRRLQIFLWVPLQAQLQWLPVFIACYGYAIYAISVLHCGHFVYFFIISHMSDCISVTPLQKSQLRNP